MRWTFLGRLNPKIPSKTPLLTLLTTFFGSFQEVLHFYNASIRIYILTELFRVPKV